MLRVRYRASELRKRSGAGSLSGPVKVTKRAKLGLLGLEETSAVDRLTRGCRTMFAGSIGAPLTGGAGGETP